MSRRRLDDRRAIEAEAEPLAESCRCTSTEVIYDDFR